MAKPEPKFIMFHAALVALMTVIFTAPAANAGQVGWYFHASDYYQGKQLSEYFEDLNKPLNAGSTYVFLVLGDKFMQDLELGTFNPDNETIFYSDTDYKMSEEYVIKSSYLGAGSDAPFPLQYVLLTFLVISVNNGVLGESGCQYDYHYIQRSVYVRTDGFPGQLSSQNVYGTITSGSSIPEPATGALALAGLGLLLRRRRR